MSNSPRRTGTGAPPVGHSAFRGTIPPIPPGEPRPLWSVMIPSYNCADYLSETLRSVLTQDPGPHTMQIEVVDDASGDDPQAVVEEIGRGRVWFFRQPHNVGHVANFNTCLRRARGSFVHILHGDDLVLPGFYATLGAALEQHPRVGAAFCSQVFIDEEGEQVHVSRPEEAHSGILQDWLRRIAEGQRLQTPSIVVRRRVYEQLGGFDSRLSYGEDWEMWVRIAAAFPVWYEPEPMAAYRMHGSSISGRQLRTGANIRDLRRGVEINRAVLPLETVDAISRRAYRNIALSALRRARRLLKARDRETALVQAREAFRTSRSPVVFAQAIKVVLLWLVKYIWIRKPPSTRGRHA